MMPEHYFVPRTLWLCGHHRGTVPCVGQRLELFVHLQGAIGPLH